MADRKQIAETLIGPPSDPYHLAARVGDPRRVRISERPVDPPPAGVLTWMVRLAMRVLDAKARSGARIWFD